MTCGNKSLEAYFVLKKKIIKFERVLEHATRVRESVHVCENRAVCAKHERVYANISARPENEGNNNILHHLDDVLTCVEQ